MNIFVYFSKVVKVQPFLLTLQKIRCIQVPFISFQHILIEGLHCNKRRIKFKFDKLGWVAFSFSLKEYLWLKISLIDVVHEHLLFVIIDLSCYLFFLEWELLVTADLLNLLILITKWSCCWNPSSVGCCTVLMHLR